jgi:mannose-6-phosphate isomerase
MTMDHPTLYPLRFEPIYQYRLWGGRRLAHLLSAPLPGDRPIGEAWILTDRDDHRSLVANGPLKGKNLQELIKQFPEEMLGKLAGHCHRFPLLLKFLDVGKTLSVQVHPPDAYKELIPPGETGKTEAWVVLQTGPEARIYAGLKAGATAEVLRQAITNGTVSEQLAHFIPKVGDAVLIPAGTVHALSDVVVFEVQENSDVTFRLFDWNHVDPQTNRPRPLQIDQALACINFKQGEIRPKTPVLEVAQPILRERLMQCDHFGVWRMQGDAPFTVGAASLPRVLVCLAGKGDLEQGGVDCDFSQGDVVFLPAVIGACFCRPHGPVTVLEISLPEISMTP